MAKITIGGREYNLLMSLWASEQLEKKYGDLKDALTTFRKDRSITMVKEMFAIMANAGEKAAKRPTDVMPDVLDDCSMATLSKISQAMNAALDETMHAETVGGNEADDETQDALAAEYDEKNG